MDAFAFWCGKLIWACLCRFSREDSWKLLLKLRIRCATSHSRSLFQLDFDVLVCIGIFPSLVDRLVLHRIRARRRWIQDIIDVLLIDLWTTLQELHDLFRVPETGFQVSVTQRQMAEEHAGEHRTYVSIVFLHRCLFMLTSLFWKQYFLNVLVYIHILLPDCQLRFDNSKRCWQSGMNHFSYNQNSWRRGQIIFPWSSC